MTTKDKNSAEITIDEKKGKAILKIRDARPHDLKVKKVGGKLKIYKDTGYETIFFNSWEYGNEEKPWIPFMIKVVDELFEDEIDKKELIKNIFLFSTDAVLQKYSQTIVSTGAISNLIEKSRKNRHFKNWSHNPTKTVIERVTKIEEFKERIKKRAEKSSKGKIIIFIDDLDRIPEEKIVDFLDSLKIFLDISGCIFVLGCDYEILKNALKKKHGEEEIYKDYFDKIVQTEFYIPKISEQAIKNYLQFLTPWNDNEIEECTQLVIHSIGGNPRKIKRVVNATMLIKSVFEKKLATFLHAFERPKPGIKIKRGGEGKEEENEEPQNINISTIFTPAEVFDFLFDKEMLFKLMCTREQWPDYYEDSLSEEKKQNGLISLQEGDITADIWDYTEFSTAKEQKELEENVKKLSHFLKDPPGFKGLDRSQKVMSLKTYLTVLEISSPEAGIALIWEEPEKLPIYLFNRYMFFERINKGEVDKTSIKEKVKQVDWKGNLSSYHFFIEVIGAFRYDDLLRGLFRKDQVKPIVDRIKDTSSDLKAIGRLLYDMRKIEKETAEKVLNETWETYAGKIKASSHLGTIGWLLKNVMEIEKETAKELLNETKDAYANKIRTSTDPWAIGWLLNSVWTIEEKTARVLFNEIKDTLAEKIRASTDSVAIRRLLGSVWKIERETARVLLNEIKDTYAEEIRTSTDPVAIGRLIDSVWKIERETARVLLHQTSATYAKKIRASTDPVAIEWLLNTVREIDENTAKVLLKETWETYAEKIRTSTDPVAIGRLLDSVKEIDEDTAKMLEKETKLKSEEK
uniref:KAP NTPase domain-containing protein n=1 Tax=Candidatus Methanophaga sp. ANME-1 ERB7 TaxID=2759913 RepID=A0A7G9ZBP2_9EURY|nr:hypothetical protein NMCMJOEM_00014 [Methanosarcinales archaeon ANME-1 ERB7]